MLACEGAVSTATRGEWEAKKFPCSVDARTHFLQGFYWVNCGLVVPLIWAPCPALPQAGASARYLCTHIISGVAPPTCAPVDGMDTEAACGGLAQGHRIGPAQRPGLSLEPPV